jgi:hypothetical protein
MARLISAMDTMLHLPQTRLLLAAIGIVIVTNDWIEPVVDILIYAIWRLSR